MKIYIVGNRAGERLGYYKNRATAERDCAAANANLRQYQLQWFVVVDELIED